MDEKYRTRNARSLFAIDFLGRGFNSRRLHHTFHVGGNAHDPRLATQGETMEELRSNLREAIEGCLSVPVEPPSVHTDDKVIELAL